MRQSWPLHDGSALLHGTVSNGRNKRRQGHVPSEESRFTHALGLPARKMSSYFCRKRNQGFAAHVSPFCGVSHSSARIFSASSKASASLKFPFATVGSSRRSTRCQQS